MTREEIKHICDLYNEGLIVCNKVHAKRGLLDSNPKSTELLMLYSKDKEAAHNYVHQWIIDYVTDNLNKEKL